MSNSKLKTRRRKDKLDVNLSVSRPQQKKGESKLPQKRLLLVWTVLVAGILGLGWRLYQLQIVEADKLQQRAQQQQVMSLRPYMPRRSVVDRQGNILATDRLVYSLFVHPKLFTVSKETIAEQLAPILEQSPQKLIERFNQRESGIRVAYDLREETADKIERLPYNGIELIEHYARFYPQQEMFADVIGYVDRDRQGQAGIEMAQKKLLELPLPTYKVRRAGNGTIVPAYLPEGLLKFEDQRLQLTLDLRLQRAARSALKQATEQYSAKRGTVIVMDARDGSLLALVCEPTYNSNRYYNHSVELFKNWAVSDLYEPGSTFKPINVAIALDAGAISPDIVLHDPGKTNINGWNIFNHDFHDKGGNGYINIAQILQKSSNIGMIQIMQRLKKDDYYQALKELGLREKLGVDLPGDAPGYLKNQTEFTGKDIEVATAAFGQGLSLTPLKLVQLQAAIANGGKLVTPHVIQGLTDSQGELRWQPDLPTKSVFSPETSQTVLEMMETVVEEGSGEPAQIPGYRIAGKTGTAQKAAGGSYHSSAKITSFVGMIPVEAPRYVVLAVVDEPKGGNTFGSTVAAPIVKSVMEALISVKGIPPSVNQGTMDNEQSAPNATQVDSN